MIQFINTTPQGTMNSDLRHFVSKYLTIVFGTLMLVSFVAFVSISYSLGHFGEDDIATSTHPTLMQSITPASKA
jgi:hypothetical protein